MAKSKSPKFIATIDKKFNKFKIKHWYYLIGPLALVSLVLFDVLGGLNFPDYNWFTDAPKKILAGDSNSFVIGLIFILLYLILALFSAFCIYRFFKSKRVNKLMKRGLLILMIGIFVTVLSMCIFNTQNASTQNGIISAAQIVTKTENVQSDDGESSETKTVVDEDATSKNEERFSELMSQPDVLANGITASVATLLCLAAYVLIALGGFKKRGILFMGCIAIASGIFLLFGLIAPSFLGSDIFGINSRFAFYCDGLFLALASSYIYVTFKEK